MKVNEIGAAEQQKQGEKNWIFATIFVAMSLKSHKKTALSFIELNSTCPHSF